MNEIYVPGTPVMRSREEHNQSINSRQVFNILCIPESFKTNISHYIITLVNSHKSYR